MNRRKGKLASKIEPRFATWKFELLDSLNGDPALSGSHVKIMLPYLRFCDGPSKAVFLSMTDLRIKTGLAEATIRDAKRTLQALGYLEKCGVAACGADLFVIRNPRMDLVSGVRLQKSMVLRRADADRKAKLRIRLMQRQSGVEEMSPSDFDGAVSNVPLKKRRLSPSKIEGKYDLNTTVVSMEERDHPQIVQSISSNGYQSAQDDDEVPFAVPSSDIEADVVIAAIIEGENLTSNQRSTLKKLLHAGFLTPASARRMIENFRFSTKGKSDAAA